MTSKIVDLHKLVIPDHVPPIIHSDYSQLSKTVSYFIPLSVLYWAEELRLVGEKTKFQGEIYVCVFLQRGSVFLNFIRPKEFDSYWIVCLTPL